MDPTYVRVGESHRRVTLTVTRRSEHQLIVRTRAAFHPDKVSPIHEINEVEMRPGPSETASNSIPPHPHPYWLAVEVLRDTGAGWTRVIPRRSEGVEVPHSFEFDWPDVALDITYS